MHRIFLVIFMAVFSLISTAQSKRKLEKIKLQQEKLLNETLINNLQKHVQVLASDSLEGRRAGTAGERKAINYIISQYEGAGIAPKGLNNSYEQNFVINEGKKVDSNSFFTVNGKPLNYPTDYFPLSYCNALSVNGNAARAMNEYGKPWFTDVKDWLEDNQGNPHFDIDELIKKETLKAAKKGAKCLLLYNSSKLTDNIQFNKNDTSSVTPIPVLYITNKGISEYFKDYAATQAISLQIHIKQQQRNACNVLAYIDNGATNTIILGAHLDHLGYGEDKNALDTTHLVHNGADDNASGTAALIELAKLIQKNAPTTNNYLFIHFSAEELGLFGSKYWLANPTVTISPNYMINMDMVGRYDTTHKLTIGGYGTSPTWGRLLPKVSTPLIIKYDSTGTGPSDHASFYRANMPVLFFFTGSHPDYHKATDDWDKINYEGQKDIVKFIYKIIEKTADSGKLVFTKTTEPVMSKSSRFTVSLGVIPDYGFTGTGVKIDGVSPGKLAEKIGLQAGDILIQLGEYKFADVGNYMQALSKFKKGDATQLKIKRGSEEKVFDIVF